MKRDILKTHPELVLAPGRTLRRAMEAMTRSRLGVVLVTEKDRRLLGLLTDTDIRRALLRGVPLDAPVTEAMNRRPITAPETASEEDLSAVFRRTPKPYLPIVDRAGKLAGMAAFLDYATVPKRFPNWVVIMAGGCGMRLRPLTDHTPKPMLRLGEKPILEHLLEHFISSGFTHFILTVNYLAEQIRAHFGDGSRWNARVEYLHEPKPLGTVGALGLVRKRFENPVIVSNGDILTKVNLEALLDFHKAEKGLATVCVKRHEVQLPYGVVELDDRHLRGFAEKPVQSFLINAGIYVLEPSVLRSIPRGKPLDMPQLLGKTRRRRRRAVACFPIQEYWIDIGGMQELQRAACDVGSVFGAK